MSRPAEQTSHRRLFFALAALNLLAAFWVVWDETSTRRPWKGYQHDFNRLLDDRGLGAEPIRIRQVTNPELGVVDRCSSCHLGIDRADVEDDDVPPVFRSHPRRAELLAKHPVARYGCTICHQGQGAQTKGVGWRDFDHGRDDPYWDTPMPAPVFAESACATCHADDGRIAGADTFERGRALFVERRCFGCHEARFVDPGFEAAPPLDHIAAKTAPGVLAAWLRDPAAFRPATAMPTFWPEPLSADGTPL
ncbi:MAG TPA: hypothetical protein VL172_20875, partial [Kofleriaceae bacterium]|nr:hypothetical protein [Kofleriaceae bacterium]